jgi:hypothetical protein
MAAKKKNAKTRKVVVSLSSEVVMKIDQEMKKLRETVLGSKPTRSEVCASFIEEGINKCAKTEYERNLSSERIITQANSFRDQAAMCLTNGENNEASSLYLMAASKELEALAILQTRNENIIKSTIIETIQFIQKGTGYRTLPVLPLGKCRVDFHS